MRKSLTKLALTASIALALAFTLSCSSDDGGGSGGGDGSSSSSVAGGLSRSSSSKPSGGLSSQSGAEYKGGSCNASDYGSVTIGTQVWMSKNWGCYVPGSKCYDNSEANCNKYGRLYDWATAMGIDAKYNKEKYSEMFLRHQGICPAGWHLPNSSEWSVLEYHVKDDNECDDNCLARYLMATIDWADYATDKYGFSALLGGLGYSDGSFGYGDGSGHWWSSDEKYKSEKSYAHSEIMSYGGLANGSSGYDDKDRFLSVRCVKD